MSLAPNAGLPLPPAERTRLARLVKLHGEERILADFQVSKQTLARALAGLGVRRGTISLIRERMSMLFPTAPLENAG